MIRSEKGSALVLTLLFITLLTTMSTAMYLYSSKQSMFADSNYTSIAAGYVADAGLEAGKSILINSDIQLNTYGQNPADGVVNRDDYPVIFPISRDVGRYDTTSPYSTERLTDNKQGVGNYSLRIDAAYSEIVDFDVELRRTVGFDPSLLTFGSFNRINRLLPGETVKIQVRQGIEVVNKAELNFQDRDIINSQVSGTTTYEPINMANIINPYIGDDITIELNRTSIIDPGTISNREQIDVWGNPLVLPIEQCLGGSVVQHISRDRVAQDSLFFEIYPNRGYGTYVMEIHNLDTTVQNDIEIDLYYSIETPDFGSGTRTNHIERVVQASDWGSVVNDRLYAILDFAPDGFCRRWERQEPGPTGHIAANGLITTNLQMGPEAIIMEIRSPGNTWQSGINVSITRGVPGEISLGLRMRTEGMDPNCWWPDYPNCNSGPNYQEIMVLSPFDDSVDYYLTPDMLTLGHRSAISVHELYTITSVGNVEDAMETRQLMVSPVSFLDYARFTQSRLTIGNGALFGGLVYCSERIELPNTGTAFFYDDLVTSSRVVNPGSASFLNSDGEIIEGFPLIEFPDLQDMALFYNNNRANAWEIGSPHHLREYDLFLGNYDYINSQVETEFWGLDFSQSPPTYHEPTANIRNSESFSYRTGWTPGALGPDSTNLPMDFNGLIYVNGDVHVWGTLHGRSVTIMARGDIIIEREIIMGTDELDPSSPEGAMSKRDGMPVHLNLVPLLQTGAEFEGDVVISENAPRILTIESGIMAFAGTLTTEDNDWDPDNLDSDNSHAYYFPDPPAPNASYTYYRWRRSDTWPTIYSSYDLNRDGRLTNGLDYITDYGLPYIELGSWNERAFSDADKVWYLMVIGPFIDRDGAAAGHYASRSLRNLPGSENGNTRNYRYDPSYRINSPPFVPAPRNSLRVLPWNAYVNELPN